MLCPALKIVAMGLLMCLEKSLKGSLMQYMMWLQREKFELYEEGIFVCGNMNLLQDKN